MTSNNDPFNREFNKRETKRRTIKSWLFLGFIFLIFVIAELIHMIFVD